MFIYIKKINLAFHKDLQCCIPQSRWIMPQFLSHRISKMLTSTNSYLFTYTFTLEIIALFLHLNKFIGFTTDFNRNRLLSSSTSLCIARWWKTNNLRRFPLFQRRLNFRQFKSWLYAANTSAVPPTTTPQIVGGTRKINRTFHIEGLMGTL